MYTNILLYYNIYNRIPDIMVQQRDDVVVFG